MSEFSKVSEDTAGRNSLYLFASYAFSQALGFIFWILVSQISNSNVLGDASAATTLSASIIGITALGIPTGSKRLVGISLGENDLSSVRVILKKSLLLVFVSTLVVSFSLVLMVYYFPILLNLSFPLILISSITAIFAVVVSLLKGVFVASLRTGSVLVTETIGTTFKILLGTVFLIYGLEAIGATLGHLVGFISMFILFMVLSRRLFSKEDTTQSDISNHDIVEASLPSWIPNILAVLGTQLGIIVVIGFNGSLESGLYFVAFSLFSFIAMVPKAIATVAFPVMSGMKSGKEFATEKIMKMSIIIAMPLSLVLFKHPTLLLILFGSDFLNANLMLQILLIGIAPISISQGIIAYVYAQGRYRMVLVLGILENIPRTILYFLLVPLIGGIGASLSYLIGSLILLFGSIFSSSKANLKINWDVILLIIVIPFSLFILFYFISLPLLIDITLFLAICFIVYSRLKLLTRYDLTVFIQIILPKKYVTIFLERFKPIIDVLFGNSD
ncbi:MAG: membrane protein of unknown function [Candidatus Thorarchaeota archaeon]|nr:MAG: membrane protein of unknown function [Candidatus Thorarchaeota archaeon]